MIIQLLLKERGEWWDVEVPNTAAIKHILNSRDYKGQAIQALRIDYLGSPMIYDFIIRQWR